MSDTIGPRTLGQKQGGEVFLGRDWGSTPDYSDAVAFEIDQEVRQLIDEAHDVALDILVENREKLDALASRAVGEGDARPRSGRAVLPRRREARTSRGRGTERRSRRVQGEPEEARASPVEPRNARGSRTGPCLAPGTRPYNPRMPPDRWATFDCYGTLIDWMAGIRGTLGSPVARCRRRDAPVPVSPDRARSAGGSGHPLQDGDGRGARARGDGRRAGVPAGREDALGASLPTWPRVPGRAPVAVGAPGAGMEARRSCRTPTPTSWTRRSPRSACRSICASWRPTSARTSRRSDTGSRSSADPGRPCASRARGGVALPRRRSRAPHSGLPCVWINRQDETSDLPRAGELTDLVRLPDMLDGLVPPGDG